MAQYRERPQVQRAYEHLREWCDEHYRRGEQELPGIRVMAARAGVSFCSMRRAAHRLAAEGRLEIAAGRRVRIPGVVQGSGDESPHALPRERWRLVEQQIRRDILTGVYRGRTALPGHKELHDRYGASYHTVRKALNHLVQDGVLRVCGRSLRVSVKGLPMSVRGRIVYIARSRGGGLPMVFASRSAETAQALDEECARRGIRLTLSTCHYISHRLVFPDDWAHRSREHVAAESVLGFIVDRASIGDYMGELLPALARFGRPVSVLMDRPVSDDGPWVHEQHPRVTVTLVQAILDREAGLAVGNYLVARGHRRVAYIGPERHIQWSRDRLSGLVDAMRSADPGAEVAVFPLPEANQPDSRSLVPELTRVLKDTLPHVFAMALGASSYRETPFLRQVAASSYDYHALLFRTPIWSLRGFEDAAGKAHRRPELTAWVCGNEKVAVLAHDYLVSAGVRVPGELSLIGIDDVQETLIRRTTMHSFVPRMAVETAINAILKPRLLRQDHEGVHTVCIRGEIRERGSVAALSRPAER